MIDRTLYRVKLASSLVVCLAIGLAGAAYLTFATMEYVRSVLS